MEFRCVVCLEQKHINAPAQGLVADDIPIQDAVTLLNGNAYCEMHAINALKVTAGFRTYPEV